MPLTELGERAARHDGKLSRFKQVGREPERIGVVLLNRREDVERPRRLRHFESHIEEPLVDVVAPLDVGFIHLLRHMAMVLQCLNRCILARKCSTDGVVEVHGSDILHDGPVADDISDAPAGHGMRLAEAAHDEHLLLDIRIACETDVFPFKRILRIDLIGDDEDVMLPEHFDEFIHLLLRIGDAGRVRRIVEQYGLRLLRNIRLDQFRSCDVARRRHVDELRRRAAQFNDRARTRDKSERG